MAVLWWCSVLSLLVASQATSEERCSIWSLNCYQGVSYNPRLSGQRQLSYEECVTRSTETWKTVSSCWKNGADALILKKSCTCPASSIGWALAYDKRTKFDVKRRCLDFDDIKLSTCPSRASQCKQHIQKFVESIRSSFGKGDSYGPGAVFQQCNNAQQKSFTEVQKCISDAETADLSGCGSVKYMVDQFLPLVKFMASYVCSGCPVYRLVQGCLPRISGLEACRIITSTSEITQILECVRTQMSSAPQCSSGTPLVPAEFIQMAFNMDAIISSKEYCEVTNKFDKEYASWNCPSNKLASPTRRKRRYDSSHKRLSPTRWKRRSDSLDLMNLVRPLGISL